MSDPDQMRAGLARAIGGVRRGREVADQLCLSFVELLDVDGAALAVIVNPGLISSSMGTSGPLSNELMELQFMLGEGPCAASMASTVPVLASDLDGAEANAWSTFSGAAYRLGVRAMFALPVTVAGFPIGALFLYRTRTGPLPDAELEGAFFAADLAALPILDVMGMDLDAAIEDETSGAWAELASLARSEVYQAAGVLIAQLGITPAEALVRLRGHAFANARTTSEAAYDILEHRVWLGDDRAETDPEERSDGRKA